jgi:glycine/D-amino acid oxidase-like deaminating enzyme
MHNFDVIIVGAGSVGVPTAMALGAMGMKTLVVDAKPSPGQGDNKRAIGGIRATHSDPGKILVGLRSLEIFSTWKERYGEDIEWLKGGYLFPVYREHEERSLKRLLPLQRQFGLNIDFIDSDSLQQLVPGIDPDRLMGGTFSPADGSASPLLAINAFARKALENGVRFQFNEPINTLLVENRRVVGVETDKGRYRAPVVVDAAGAYSRPLCLTAGVDLPVTPDSHEGAITEPVARMFSCMVVDLRPGPGSKNYYFYQNVHGQVVFCITPDPPIVGTDTRETSVFLPQVAARMVALIPRLKTLRVRRVWRGCYPMSPDGSPIVGWSPETEGLFHATGMCGQGFMLGPGMGELVARMITGSDSHQDKDAISIFSPARQFSEVREALK